MSTVVVHNLSFWVDYKLGVMGSVACEYDLRYGTCCKGTQEKMGDKFATKKTVHLQSVFTS